MADRYWGKLEFPAALIDAEVSEALRKEGVEMDKLDESVNHDNYAYIEDGIFIMENFEARNGCWENLETILRLKGIPFDRESSGDCKFDPEFVVYRPGLIFVSFLGTNAIAVEKIRSLLANGVEAVTAYLDEHFPPYVPLSDYVKKG
jgi:hypothetical protein